ncbi:MAG: PorV/PorQ family protein [Elusimicrobiota bacterium]
MKKFLLIGIIIVTLQYNYCNAANDWGLPGEYLNWGAGARSLGMGKAFVGLADDSSAVYWNPAGISRLRSTELLFLHTNLFENTNYEFVSITHPMPWIRSGFGVGFVMLNSTDFEERDEYNSYIGEFNNKETAFITSYSYNPRRNIYLGGSFKIIKQQIGDLIGSSQGLDLGVLYFLRDHISFGLLLRNLAPPSIKMDKVSEIYYLSPRFGVALRLLENKLIITTDVLKQREQEFKFYSGLEFSPVNNFYARAGVDETELTFGLGIKYEKVIFDYAAGLQDLGISHRISITFHLWDLAPKIKSKVKEFSSFGGKSLINLSIQSEGIVGIKRWKLTVKDDEDRVVRTFQDENEPPKKILWDGKDENNNFVKDGAYRCLLSVYDKTDKLQESNVVRVRMVSKIPDAIIKKKEMIK